MYACMCEMRSAVDFVSIENTFVGLFILKYSE